jgi:hypothetical protein
VVREADDPAGTERDEIPHRRVRGVGKRESVLSSTAIATIGAATTTQPTFLYTAYSTGTAERTRGTPGRTTVDPRCRRPCRCPVGRRSATPTATAVAGLNGCAPSLSCAHPSASMTGTAIRPSNHSGGSSRPKARYDHTAGAAFVHRRGRERTGQREHDAHRREHNGQPRPAEEVVDDNPDDGHGSEQVEVPVAHRETVATTTGRCSRSPGRQLRPAGLPRTNEVSVLSVRLCDDHDPWPSRRNRRS